MILAANRRSGQPQSGASRHPQEAKSWRMFPICSRSVPSRDLRLTPEEIASRKAP